jgi:hypothetical protein
MRTRVYTIFSCSRSTDNLYIWFNCVSLWKDSEKNFFSWPFWAVFVFVGSPACSPDSVHCFNFLPFCNMSYIIWQMLLSISIHEINILKLSFSLRPQQCCAHCTCVSSSEHDQRTLDLFI